MTLRSGNGVRHLRRYVSIFAEKVLVQDIRAIVGQAPIYPGQVLRIPELADA